ncbi:hypothetical protein SESBI_49865 [Sesbania bispinosa]|nr:hypothetical protein SESBI_49865 [Sesbania bispinosa]
MRESKCQRVVRPFGVFVEGRVRLVLRTSVADEIQIEPHLEERNKHEVSNMYTRLKEKPRKRVVSGKVSSLWMAYPGKRKKKEGVLQN